MIKLKKLLKEAVLPKVLYHSVTTETIRDFVLKNGIKADSSNFVYLSTKPITKAPFKYTFEVTVPDPAKLWDWRDIWSDDTEHTYDEANPYYVYEGDIAKQFVKLQNI